MTGNTLPGFLKKLRGFLFLKILLVFGLALIAAVAFVIYMHRIFFLGPIFPEIQRNAVNYALYIIDEIDHPPDLEKARELGRKLQIKVRYQSPTLSWATHEDMIDFSNKDLPPFDVKRGIYAGFGRDGLTAEIKRPQGRYLVVVQSREARFRRVVEEFMLVLLIFVIIMIIAIYFTMTRLLKPVKTLHEGVRQLSKGNIDYHMTTTRSDELGKLIHSFNEMSRRIREMLHSRDRLLLDVSHELRSPLTRVKVALEFLDESIAKQNIRDDIAEMETMITELLETERLNSQYGGLKKEKVNLKELLTGILSEYKDRVPGITFVSLAENIVLAIDPERFKILLRNILENALRYSPADGYPVEISLREKPGEVIISIQDFGSGIPEQDLPYIFEPFYRVDKSRSKETGGYGLGMSLAKTIMDAHNGEIQISSRLNTGTTIFLRFPIT